jgi:hypothetical protein
MNRDYTPVLSDTRGKLGHCELRAFLIETREGQGN